MRRKSARGISSSDLRTLRNDTFGIIEHRFFASSYRAFMSGFLTLYSPFICLMTSCESMTNSASVPL